MPKSFLKSPCYMLRTTKDFSSNKKIEQGERASHLLVTIVRSQQTSSHIAKLILDEGVEDTGMADIVLQKYYKCLYSSKFCGRIEDLTDYLPNIPVPELSKQWKQELLQSAPNEKSSWSNGLPTEFFKHIRRFCCPVYYQYSRRR